MAWIYQIRNVDNDKVYIGSTAGASARKRHHFGSLKRDKHENPHLQRAYNLSPESFRFELLVEVSEDQLLERERDTISCYVRDNEIDRTLCYNLVKDPTRPRHSSESIEKCRQGRLGKKHSEETRQRMSIAATGRKASAETVAQMHERKLTPEHIEKIRKARIGVRHNPETIEKCRQANLGKPKAPEHIAKMRTLRHTPESKEKMRQAALARYKP